MKLGTAGLLTAGSRVPDVAGTPFGGGFYVGRLKVAGVSYALIVAPKAAGESSALAWKTSGTTTTGTTSRWDGAANTAAMIAAGASLHPAANYCKNLTIGGFTDWFLPAIDQLELCYRFLKPGIGANSAGSGDNPSSDPVGAQYTSSSPAQTNAAIFTTGGGEDFAATNYFSSTELSSSSANYQSFNTGAQSNSSKGIPQRVRAVRMVKI